MRSRAKGTGYATARSPSKAQRSKPRPLRTGRKPKKRRTPNGCCIYGGAPSSTPPKIPRPNPMWFGSMSRLTHGSDRLCYQHVTGGMYHTLNPWEISGCGKWSVEVQYFQQPRAQSYKVHII